ncbi:polysaccharide deacetylase family protein [Anaerotignum lactatifermentans]|uniref:Polysaccharide deacetylase family protein n=1 Tax=Anaerotignum lactatifermentans TaxID=160404 RepID=A0ABS2G909_9FIRM|nr:polysaccharide deacetylase family protein [Anaerotignum lactatifermentans]MBM6828507.1 polysaccharide deacetylase family protein [Anaerotignum lactatifermentans]MBM6877914.1 polysaccharide deacetylase family protein [Anaerotignum lactatifermentans]MBM6950089.1 polysaccharide deacetylase family protein [Anaerotignum lactatifermentans]
MQIFKTIHIRKIHMAAAAILIAAVAAAGAFLPPAAQKAAAVLSAEGKRELPIYCVNTSEKKVAVTFDAAWGADDTDELLRILEENDVKATFFLCGYWVEKYPEEVKKIAEAGHDLGNHSATHPHMSQLSAEQITQELEKCHNAVKELTGIEMDLFRPPFGEYNNTVIQTANANNYLVIQWDIDTLDTKRKEGKHFVSPLFI